MSIVNDSITAIFNDDSLSENVLANGVYGKGYFEQPHTFAFGDQYMFQDYLLHLDSSVYPNLKTADEIEVANERYKVREVQKSIDGASLEVSLEKI